MEEKIITSSEFSKIDQVIRHPLFILLISVALNVAITSYFFYEKKDLDKFTQLEEKIDKYRGEAPSEDKIKTMVRTETSELVSKDDLKPIVCKLCEGESLSRDSVCHKYRCLIAVIGNNFNATMKVVAENTEKKAFSIKFGDIVKKIETNSATAKFEGKVFELGVVKKNNVEVPKEKTEVNINALVKLFESANTLKTSYTAEPMK